MGLVRTIYDCLKLRHNDKLPPARIQALQLRNLRKAVRYAKKHSPFYAELYRDVDPGAADFSVQALPPVTKNLLTRNFDRVVTDSRIKLDEVTAWARNPANLGKLYRRRYVVTHTSGTTGMPAIFVYDRREWDMIQAVSVTRGVRFKPSFFQFFRYAGRVLVKKVRVALVSVLGGHFVTYLLFLITPGLARKRAQFEFLSVTRPLKDLVASLNRLDPNVLHCYPTMLEVLAHEQKEGRLHIRPWIISSSSEPLTGPARRMIQEAFPESPVYETYGTTEGVTLASECRFHRGMHVNNDHYILEPGRDDGTPVEPGEAGDKAYLSCLFSRTMPLLRYELTDVIIPLAETCHCGLPFPMVKVRGRTDDIFWVYDAEGDPVALPPIPFEAMLLDVVGMRQYQLIQEERNFLRVLFRPMQGVEPESVRSQIQNKFDSFLQEKGLTGSVRIQIEQVDEILRDPKSGKIRQIFSKVERLYMPGMPLGDRRSGEDRRTREQRQVEGERRVRPRRDEDTGEVDPK